MKNNRWVDILRVLIVLLALGLGTGVQAAASAWEPAVQAFVTKDFQRSETLIKEVMAARGQDDKEAYMLMLAENYRHLQQLDQARPIYLQLEQGAKSKSIKFSAAYRLAELAYHQQAYRQSLEFLNEIPGNREAGFLVPSIQILQMKNLLKLGKNRQAQHLFQNLEHRYPRALLDSRIKLIYAIIKDNDGKTMEALKLYQELTDYPLVYLLTGRILESLDRLLPAIESYQKAIDQSPLPGYRQLAAYLKCQAFYKLGDYLSAQKISRQLLSEPQRSPYFAKLKLLELLIAFGQGQFQHAVELARQSSSWADKLDKKDQGLTTFVLAEAYLNMDQFPQAIAAYRQALDQAEDLNEEIQLKLAYLYALDHDWKECRRYLDHYFDHAKKPRPLAYLIAVLEGYATKEESAAFNALEKLSGNQQGLDEIGLHYMASYYKNLVKPAKLIEQWTLLKHQIRRQELPSDLREIAAQVRIMVGDAYFQERKYDLARDCYQQANRLYPYDSIKAETLPGLSWCSYKMKDYGKLSDQNEKVQRMAGIPSSIKREIALISAHAQFNLKAYTDAIIGYQKWLDMDPDRSVQPEVYFQMGWAYYLNEDYLDAIETWQKEVRLFPGHSMTRTALTWIGDTYFQAGKNQDARKIYDQLLHTYPESQECKAWRLRIAQTFYNDVQDKEAVYRFIEIMRQYPGTAEAQEAQKGIESASYRIADALDTIPAFQSFLSQYPDSYLAEDILYRIGAAYFQKEHYKECVQSLSDYVLKFTKSQRLAQAQYYILVSQDKLSELPAAMAQAQAFLQTYPQHELAPEVTFRLASMAFQQGDYQSAAEWFVACAENFGLKKYQPKAWYNAAIAYEKIKQPMNAASYYEKLLGHFPDDENAEASIKQLAHLYLTMQQMDKVEALLTSVQDHHQALLPPLWLDVSNYYRDQDDVEAQQKYLKLITSSTWAAPQTASLAWIELAAIYEKQKAWEPALTAYQKLIKITTEKKWIKAAKKRVALLKQIIKSD